MAIASIRREADPETLGWHGRPIDVAVCEGWIDRVCLQDTQRHLLLGQHQHGTNTGRVVWGIGLALPLCHGRLKRAMGAESLVHGACLCAVTHQVDAWEFQHGFVNDQTGISHELQVNGGCPQRAILGHEASIVALRTTPHNPVQHHPPLIDGRPADNQAPSGVRILS